MYDKFLNFVARMRGTRTIRHNSGWCGCAVGDFAKTIDADPYKLAEELAESNPRLLGALNDGVLRDDLHTYGGLQEYIANLDADPLTMFEHAEALKNYEVGYSHDWPPVYS